MGATSGNLEWQIASLKQGDHLCLLYESAEEQLAAAIPFMREGLAAGERCFYIADDRSAQEIAAALVAFGVDVAREIDRGALVIATKRETYFSSGMFDPAAMIDVLREAERVALARGFSGFRVTGEMTWALGSEAGTDRLIEYEALLNDFFPFSRSLAICQYNRTRFPPAMVRQVLRTHPLAILGDQVCPNLYYEPASAVLGEMTEAARVNWMIEQLRRASKRDEELRFSEARLAAIISTACEGIVSIDAGGRITLFSEGAERIFGYSAKEVLGTSLDILLPEQVRAAHRQHVEHLAAAERARPMWQMAVVGRRKDGVEFPAETNVSSWKKGGEITCTAIIRDVSERVSLQAQLAQAQKMEAVGRLAGGVAHDFNNLLTTIMGYSDVLLPTFPADDDRRKDIEEIRKASESAASLTQQLLAFSRKQILEPVVLDLNAVVGNLDRMLRRLIGEDIQVIMRLHPELGLVKADPGQMEQVILNLAVNARDAMPEGGALTIETGNAELDEHYSRTHAATKPGHYAMLALSDTGQGMDEHTQAHLFEPFFTTKEKGKGTGLGLATVYGIVKQSEGNIWFYSEPGHGTTFKVYLPRVEGVASRLIKPPPAVPLPTGTETILVVEDNDGLVKLARKLLEWAGYTVLSARDGDEAAGISERYKGAIHLLLTDVIMPGMSGRALADRLVGVRPEMKVLYTSGYAIDAIARYGVLEAGIPFLQKPYTRQLVTQKVREVLDAAK